MSDHIVSEGRTDAAANASTNSALAVGEIFNGHLDSSDDSDWIRVELAAGASYMIRVEPRDPDGSGPQMAAADTALEILNAAGDRVAMKDDLSVADQARYPGADAKHPIVMFEPDAAGVYYLSVSSFAGVAATDNSGGYSLELTQMTPLDPNRDMELTGTAGADKLVGAGGEDNIKGGAGDDFLSGGGENDTLEGEAGDDTLEGGPGRDTLDGGANGSAGDTITYAGSAEAVRVNLVTAEATGGDAEGDVIMNIENIVGSAGDDWLRGDANDNALTGGTGADTLIGGGGNDALTGGAGDDTLNGGEGDDTLTGGAGADTITGGPGGDTLSYAGSDEAVDIRLGSGHASGGHAEGDVYRDVEHVTGSDHNDRLAGDNRPADASTGGDNTLSGGGGDDAIYGGSGDDALNGDGGDDTLHGGAGGDTLNGGAGDDTLIGGPGADSFTGGAGEDTVSYATAQDEKVSVDLTRTASAAPADPNNPSHSDGDYFPTGHGVENVIGSPRGDAITGDDGPNKLWGGAGADTLTAFAGNDTIDGGPGGDSINGGVGEDTVTYENSDAGVRVTVNATTGNEGGEAEGDRLSRVENLVGSDHNDRLFGDSGNNKLSGGAGDDRIVANAGNDRVEGGAGADTMDGDAVSAAESGYAAAPVDSDTLSYASSSGAVTIDLSGQYAVAASAEQQRGHYATGDGGDAAGDRFRGFENVTGGMGNDRLTGDGFNNILIGGPGADRLDGGAPQTIDSGADGVFGTADDVMTINDTDTVSYAGSTAGVTITFSERRLDNRDVTIGAGSGGDAEGDRLLNIENVTGTAHDDTFIAGNLNQVFDGGENAEDDPETPNVDESKDSDTVSYANLDGPMIMAAVDDSDHVRIENLIGSNGSDLLQGDGNPNRLEGGAGADFLDGMGGADTLIGGAGVDELNGGEGNDLIIGGGGADTLNGGDHVHVIDGRGGRANEAHENMIIAFIQASPGVANVTDPARGYDGDTLSYAGSNRGVDVTLAGVWVHFEGPDGGYYTGDEYWPRSFTPQPAGGGHAAGDTVQGTIENLIGSDHDDTLTGNGGGNAITGGKGDDIMDGNGANAINTGSRGEFGDVFIFAPGDGVDVIKNFDATSTSSRGEDRIDVRAFNFDIDGVTTLAQLVERNEGFSVSVTDVDDDEAKDDTLISLPGGGEIHLLDRTELDFEHFIFDLV